MRHIVALSGGKDSTAMALRLAEVEPRDYTYVFTPTGHEPPELFEHIKRLALLLGKPILPIMAGTLGGGIGRHKMLPNHRARWCTRELKIEPFARYLASVVPATSYVGIRADEPEREAGDYSRVEGVREDFPMRRWGWTLRDVRSYLAKRAVVIPSRTDCLECFFQRIGEWYDFWNQYPNEWARAESYEAFTGHTFRSPKRDSWPVALKDLRLAFESGQVPKGQQSDSLFKLKCRVCKL